MKMRVCTKCGQEKPETAEYFHRAKNNRVGLCTICKDCRIKAVRGWQAENPEKVKETAKRWQAKNPEKVMEAVKRWQAKNPEKVRKVAERWKAENPEKVRESEKRWRGKNMEKVRKKQKRWRDKNLGKVREIERDKDRRYRNELAPNYLKTLISAKYDIDRSEIGDELMEAKRREIKYYRQLKQLKN